MRDPVRPLRLAAALFALAVAAACSDSPPTGPARAVASLQLTPAGPHLLGVGEVLPLAATALDAEGSAVSGATITWESSDERIVTVRNGQVTAVAAGGPVEVTAASGSVSESVEVTVADEAQDQLVISPQAIAVPVGETVTLSATLVAPDGTERDAGSVTWASSNSEVASVSADGVVTGQSTGDPVLVTASAGGRSGFAMVHTGETIQTAGIDPDTIILMPGQSQTLLAGYLPYLGDPDFRTSRSLWAGTTWRSEDPTVASVDRLTGRVTAHSVGTATVTALIGTREEHATVIVSEGIEPMLVSGQGFACGLTEAGAAYCWGESAISAYSADRMYYRGLAVPAQGVRVFKSIGAGRSVLCGLTVEGDAYCNGRLVPGGHRFEAISVGATHLLGLTADGEIYTFTPDLYNSPEAPVRVESDVRFTVISAGDQRFAALDAEGRVYEWGSPWSGAPEVPTPTLTPSDARFTQVAVGADHAMALTAEGELYGWGYNFDGQLGLPEEVSWVEHPTAVPTALRFTKVSVAGYRDHNFSYTVALGTDGGLYGWGRQHVGRLGETPYEMARVFEPTRIADGIYTHIHAAIFHTLALDSEGRLVGWGDNRAGELGAIERETLAGAVALEPAIGLTVASLDDEPLTPGGFVYGVAILHRVGGFTRTRAGNPDPVRIRLMDAPRGVSLHAFHAAMVGHEATTNIRLDASSDAGSASSVTFRADAVGMDPAIFEAPLYVQGSTGEGGPGQPGSMDLACDTEDADLGDGYHCMSNSAGLVVPGWYGHPAMHGTWVDEGAEVCITWNADGTHTGRYKPAQLGGTGTTVVGPAKWGVIVKRDGTPEGTATQWYVFSGAMDPQTALLGYDSASNSIINWGFVKKACPW